MAKRRITGEKVFDVLVYVFMIILILITLYPFVYVLFASLSAPVPFSKHTGILLSPVGFDLKSYKLVFSSPFILTGYRNTLIYVSFATAVNMLMTTLGAYALSRKRLALKKPVMLMIIFTMFFN